MRHSGGVGRPSPNMSPKWEYSVANDENGSVTNWILALKDGDQAAAQPLWDRFFERLAGLVRSRAIIPRKAGVIGDEEDAALSALVGVCEGFASGKFPEVSDRDDLWRLLRVIATRKALNIARYADADTARRQPFDRRDRTGAASRCTR